MPFQTRRSTFRGLFRLLMAAFALAPTSTTANAAGARVLAVMGGQVVDPERGSVTRADVLIRGTRIIEVRHKLRPPRGAKIVNAARRYLVPGLWDMHAHVAALGPPGGAPERYVGYGVLGIRDMGGH